jgi:hypothetical protein
MRSPLNAMRASQFGSTLRSRLGQWQSLPFAGPYYDKHHAVSFEETASLEEQLRDTKTGSEVFGAGREDAIDIHVHLCKMYIDVHT